MRITTESAIEISESLATFLLGSHLHLVKGANPLFEKRLKYVDTGKFSVADIYLPAKDCAVEMKSTAHGNDALKGVVQSSVYKEQTNQAIFCMQKPNRRALVDGIESFSRASGVGVIFIVGVPTICSEQTIKRATGGNSKPFELWKRGRYTTTRNSIIHRSRSDWAKEYIETLEQVVKEKSDEIFEYAVEPDSRVEGFSELY